MEIYDFAKDLPHQDCGPYVGFVKQRYFQLCHHAMALSPLVVDCPQSSRV